MAIGAFLPDVVTRVVNVHWRGSKFVIGTLKGGLYYSSGATEKDHAGEPSLVLEKIKIPIETMSDYFRLRGGSVAVVGSGPSRKPVFLICGQFLEQSPFFDLIQFPAFICLSNDGRTWKKVYQSETGVSTSASGVPQTWNGDSFALVWKDDTFYFDLWISKGNQDASDIHEQTFRSAAGDSWSGPIKDRKIPGGHSEFSATYCINNNCIDRLGQKVPDGIMHEDRNEDGTSQFLIRPKDPPAVDYNTPHNTEFWSPVNRVELVRPATPVRIVTVSGLSQVTCVAGSGSIWMAGGWNDEAGDTGGVVISSDGGQTWTAFAAVDSGVVTLTAAAAAAT